MGFGPIKVTGPHDTYTITSFLTQGGMGKLYKALDSHGNVVIIKHLLVKPSDPLRKEYIRFFKREGDIAEKFNHSRFPQGYGVVTIGAPPDEHYLQIQQFLPGDNADTYINSFPGSIDVLEALDIAMQTCDGLRALHTYADPIYHRDIKPANLMIEHDASGMVIVRITDYGVARQHGDPAVTRVHAGTPQYKPAEMFGAFGGVTDARTDVYLVGTTLAALFRKTAFAPKNLKDRLIIVRAEIPGADLQDVICKAIEIDPKDRYQTMNEFLIALKQVYESRSGGGLPAHLQAVMPVATPTLLTTPTPSPIVPSALNPHLTGHQATTGATTHLNIPTTPAPPATPLPTAAPTPTGQNTIAGIPIPTFSSLVRPLRQFRQRLPHWAGGSRHMLPPPAAPAAATATHTPAPATPTPTTMATAAPGTVRATWQAVRQAIWCNRGFSLGCLIFVLCTFALVLGIAKDYSKLATIVWIGHVLTIPPIFFPLPKQGLGLSRPASYFIAVLGFLVWWVMWYL